MLYVYLGLRLMSLRMPLVVVIAAWETGKEGAGSIAEIHEHKGGIMGKKKPNKQTDRKHDAVGIADCQFDGGLVNMVC